jgi:hypothetical protein
VIEPTVADRDHPPIPAGGVRWLTPSVLGLASFLSDAGHEAATAALPGLLLASPSPWPAGYLTTGITTCAYGLDSLE